MESDIAAGREVGLRLVAGARIDGTINKAKFVAHVVTEQDGVRAVDLAHKRMVTSRGFLKVIRDPRAAYFGIVREAKKVGFRSPATFRTGQHGGGVGRGQRSVEHEDDLRACTSRDSCSHAIRGHGRCRIDQLAMIKTQALLIKASYDPGICKSVIATLARNHTWVTPTLVVYQPYAHAFDSASTHPEWAKYVPGIVQGGWVHRAGRIKPADSMVVRSYFSFDRTRDLKEAGVKLLAGTDMPQAFVYPDSAYTNCSFSYGQVSLVEALRTATYNPAISGALIARHRGEGSLRISSARRPRRHSQHASHRGCNCQRSRFRPAARAQLLRDVQRPQALRARHQLHHLRRLAVSGPEGLLTLRFGGVSDGHTVEPALKAATRSPTAQPPTTSVAQWRSRYRRVSPTTRGTVPPTIIAARHEIICSRART